MAPPEVELRGHSGGHFSTTGAPQTAVRGVLDSPRGGASAMPKGVSVGALKGVVSILACETTPELDRSVQLIRRSLSLMSMMASYEGRERNTKPN